MPLRNNCYCERGTTVKSCKLYPPKTENYKDENQQTNQ
jgi:hypothetical protein